MARSAIRFEAQDFHVPPPPLDARGFGEWGHGFLSRLIEWSRDPVIQSITFVPQTSYERMDFTGTADAARRDTVLYLSEDLAASARPACYDGWRGGGLYRYVGGNVWSYLLAESGITQVPGTSACTAWSWYSTPSLASAAPSPEPIVSQITSADFRAMRDRAFADAKELRRRAINPVVDWVRFERRVLSELDDNLDNPTATGLHTVALLETSGSATAPAAWANEGLYAYSTEATFGGLEGDNPWHPVERRISTDPSSQTAQWYPALAERWTEVPVIPPPPADTRGLGDWWRSSFNLASEYLRRPTVRRLRFREDLLAPYSTASTGYSTATIDVRGKTVWVQNSAVWCSKKGPVTYTGLGDWSAWLEAQAGESPASIDITLMIYATGISSPSPSYNSVLYFEFDAAQEGYDYANNDDEFVFFEEDHELSRIGSLRWEYFELISAFPSKYINDRVQGNGATETVQSYWFDIQYADAAAGSWPITFPANVRMVRNGSTILDMDIDTSDYANFTVTVNVGSATATAANVSVV